MVFEGRASAPTTEGMRLRTNFEVLRTFKGETGTHIDVLTMSSSASCGRRYVPGETYLVYAFTANGTLADNLCSRTRRSSEASTDFAMLGTGADPEPTVEEDGGVTNVEPPRIAPHDPPPVEPGHRGCSASGSALPHDERGLLGVVLFLLGVASLRRRAYGGNSSPPRSHDVVRIVRDPAARQ